MKTDNQPVHFGFDLGSISINTVVMDDGKNIIENRYDQCHGKPFELFRSIFSDLEAKYGKAGIGTVGLTGTGGELASELIGGQYINEIVAQSTSVAIVPRGENGNRDGWRGFQTDFYGGER